MSKDDKGKEVKEKAPADDEGNKKPPLPLVWGSDYTYQLGSAESSEKVRQMIAQDTPERIPGMIRDTILTTIDKDMYTGATSEAWQACTDPQKRYPPMPKLPHVRRGDIMFSTAKARKEAEQRKSSAHGPNTVEVRNCLNGLTLEEAAGCAFEGIALADVTIMFDRSSSATQQVSQQSLSVNKQGVHHIINRSPYKLPHKARIKIVLPRTNAVVSTTATSGVIEPQNPLVIENGYDSQMYKMEIMPMDNGADFETNLTSALFEQDHELWDPKTADAQKFELLALSADGKQATPKDQMVYSQVLHRLHKKAPCRGNQSAKYLYQTFASLAQLWASGISSKSNIGNAIAHVEEQMGMAAWVLPAVIQKLVSPTTREDGETQKAVISKDAVPKFDPMTPVRFCASIGKLIHQATLQADAGAFAEVAEPGGVEPGYQFQIKL
jgi:hypothetical protein